MQIRHGPAAVMWSEPRNTTEINSWEGEVNYEAKSEELPI